MLVGLCLFCCFLGGYYCVIVLVVVWVCLSGLCMLGWLVVVNSGLVYFVIVVLFSMLWVICCLFVVGFWIWWVLVCYCCSFAAWLGALVGIVRLVWLCVVLVC